MGGLNLRVATNLVWLVIFSVAVIIGALLTYASGVLFDDTYEVSVPMPEAGGVLPGQEVTVLGRAVGTVDDVELVTDGVVLTLRIRGDVEVPTGPDVTVLRRSPIGEQAVDLAPSGPTWTAAEAGTQLEPASQKVPAEVPFLLERTAELFRAMEVEDVATVVEEAALALDGRGPTLKALNRDSLELNRTLVAGIPELERLLTSSDAILETLHQQRGALADSITNAADLTQILAEERSTLEELVTTGTTALERTDTFVRSERANLSCLVGDLQALNDMLNGPSTWDGADRGRYSSKLDELEKLLIDNRYFFDQGFWIITQPDPTTGANWQRINFTSDPAGGQAYDERRATPATRPGAACQTEAWGIGVNAVRQDDPQDPDPTSPGIDYEPRVDGATATQDASAAGDASAHARTTGERDATAEAPALAALSAGSRQLPRSFGGLLLGAPGLIGLALWQRRRM